MTIDSIIRNFFLWVALIVTAFGVVLIPKSAHGQTAFGEIIGTVTDSSGGAVPGAAVTITNTATTSSRHVKTDQSGDYRAPSLLPGPYQVKVEQPGFEVSLSNVVELIVGTTLTMNLTMQVGSVTQTVEVTAKAPLLNTDSGTVGTIVDHTSIVTLPLNGRAYTDLILLTPGSVSQGTILLLGPGHNYSVSGVSYEQNNFTLDGVYDNETFFSQFAIQPSPDALQEFNVQSNITSARYGGGAGAVVNVVTKSGTNQLHGAGWEFVRNDVFDANNFFRNKANLGKPAYKQNQYGGLLSGPLVIPHLYDGRDRTFWMFNYEALKERQNSTNYATIPTVAEFGGNLQGLPPIYDPATTTQVGTDAEGNPIYSRTQFSCNGVLNVICPNRIDPLIASYASFWYPSVTQGGANNYVNSASNPLNQYQLTARIDHKINDRLQFFGRYSMANAEELSPSGLPKDSQSTYNGFRNAVASLTYLVNPTTVIDFKLGYHRNNITQGTGTDPALGAISWLNSHPQTGVGIMSTSIPTYPEFYPAGYTGVTSTGNPFIENTFEPTVNISKSLGRHSIEAGFRILHEAGLDTGIVNSLLNFTSVPTADPSNVANTGSSIASYLLGLPSSGTVSAGNPAAYMSWTDYAFYGQDNIKITPKFTLDIGLRWEYNQWPVEKYNHLSDFDTDLGEFVWAGPNPATGQGPNVRRSIIAPYYKAFAPRLGLAYQATPTTTIRGGYGIFYTGDYLWKDQGVRGEWPYAIDETGTNSNTIFPNRPVETYWPDYTSVQPGTPPSAAWTEHQNQKSAYTQQWNIGIEHQFAQNVLLEVNYIGNHGLHLPMFYAGNAPLPGPGPIGTPQHPYPFPQVGYLYGLGDVGSSDYNALQAKFEKRFSNGLSFLASYAWGHYMDVGGAAFGLNAQPQNAYDWRADWANGSYDFCHIFTMSYVYQMPFGNGKRWLSNANPIAKEALGGWTVSGITHYTTGPPANILIPIDNANDGYGSQRPDFIKGFPARVISSTDRTQGWLNPASYVVAPQYTFGNLGRNTARGPGFGNWDLGLFKDFNIHEGRQYFQFRAEGFNIFNIVDFGGPNSTINTPGFGSVNSAQPAREIQLALKFVF